MPDDKSANTTSNDTGAVISDHTDPSTTNLEEPVTDPASNQTIQPDDTANNTMELSDSLDSKDDPSMGVITNTDTGKSNKKMIATIFGVLVLVGGIAAGVFLVQQQQDFRRKAASGAACTQSPDCILFDEPGNAGSQSVPKNIDYLDITNKPGEDRRYYQGQTNDGCYNVSIDGRSFSWQKIGSGPTCKDVSNIQVWMLDEVSAISASCEEIRAYDDNWNLLSNSQLVNLDPGDSVKFAVRGTTKNATIDKARFRINSSEWQETTDNKPGEANTYYVNYTIPEGVENFTVNAQVHVVENNNWY